MNNVIARVRLALNRVGFYDAASNIHLTISRPEADIHAGTNIVGIKRAVHNKTLRLVSGSLETGASAQNIAPKTVHLEQTKEAESKTAKLEIEVKKATEVVAETPAEKPAEKAEEAKAEVVTETVEEAVAETTEEAVTEAVEEAVEEAKEEVVAEVQANNKKNNNRRQQSKKADDKPAEEVTE